MTREELLEMIRNRPPKTGAELLKEDQATEDAGKDAPLPGAGVTMTQEQFERALRNVIGRQQGDSQCR